MENERIKWAIGDLILLVFIVLLLTKLIVPFLFTWFWVILSGSFLLIFLAVIGLNKVMRMMVDENDRDNFRLDDKNEKDN